MKKTAPKKTKKTKPTIPSNWIKPRPKRKPKPEPKPKKTSPSDATRSERRRKSVGDVSVSRETYRLIAERARIESLAGSGKISPSKLVERVIVEYLDGIDAIARLPFEDQAKASKVVVGGFVIKDRGTEGPFVHVDANGKVTRAGFPGPGLAVLSAAQFHDRTGEPHKLRGEEATRSHNVADGPIRYENSEYDPTPADATPVEEEDSGFADAAANEGARIAAEDRADRESGDDFGEPT
jgi:hypothetical protein